MRHFANQLNLKIKLFIVLAIFSPHFLHAQYQPVQVDGLDPAAVFSANQTQMQFILQQQAAAEQAMADKIAAQQEAQARAVGNQQIAGLLTGLCSAMIGRPNPSTAMDYTGSALSDSAYEMESVAYRSLEEQGFQENNDWDPETRKKVGADASAKFGTGCAKFMDKEGRLGEWGNYSLGLIKGKTNSFGNNVPDDITQWCPKYPSMNQGQREMYWVWVMMSMASSESSCNPAANNHNAPNGVARGLFQVWKPVCPKARDLNHPMDNIQCAVDLLASELEDRETLMTPTSKGSKGTYWGPLRSDDWNKKRGGDISGAKKTRGLMEKYPFCK